MSTIIDNVAVNPASSRLWNGEGVLDVALGRSFRSRKSPLYAPNLQVSRRI
jgi:hypothetical protein